MAHLVVLLSRLVLLHGANIALARKEGKTQTGSLTAGLWPMYLLMASSCLLVFSLSSPHDPKEQPSSCADIPG